MRIDDETGVSKTSAKVKPALDRNNFLDNFHTSQYD